MVGDNVLEKLIVAEPSHVNIDTGRSHRIADLKISVILNHPATDVYTLKRVGNFKAVCSKVLNSSNAQCATGSLRTAKRQRNVTDALIRYCVEWQQIDRCVRAGYGCVEDTSASYIKPLASDVGNLRADLICPCREIQRTAARIAYGVDRSLNTVRTISRAGWVNAREIKYANSFLKLARQRPRAASRPALQILQLARRASCG